LNIDFGFDKGGNREERGNAKVVLDYGERLGSKKEIMVNQRTRKQF